MKLKRRSLSLIFSAMIRQKYPLRQHYSFLLLLYQVTEIEKELLNGFYSNLQYGYYIFRQ